MCYNIHQRPQKYPPLSSGKMNFFSPSHDNDAFCGSFRWKGNVPTLHFLCLIASRISTAKYHQPSTPIYEFFVHEIDMGVKVSGKKLLLHFTQSPPNIACRDQKKLIVFWCFVYNFKWCEMRKVKGRGQSGNKSGKCKISNIQKSTDKIIFHLSLVPSKKNVKVPLAGSWKVVGWLGARTQLKLSPRESIARVQLNILHYRINLTDKFETIEREILRFTDSL